MPLFGRRVAVSVGQAGQEGRRWTEDLKITFDIKHESSSKPSKGRVKIWNLSASSAHFVEQEDQKIVVEAGYGDQYVTIFAGDIDMVLVERKAPESIVTIDAGDGLTTFLSTRVSQTFGPGTSYQTVIQRIIDSMGLDAGTIDIQGRRRETTTGMSMYGHSRDYLDTLADSLDAQWWIQDGALNFVTAGSPARNEAFVLSPTTGLVGSPAPLTKKKKRSSRIVGVKIKSLLLPAMRPGHLVELRDTRKEGYYVAQKVTHKGDSRGKDFYTDIEATEL